MAAVSTAERDSRRRNLLARTALGGIIALTAVSVLVVVLIADGRVRANLDTPETVPLWTVWAPALLVLGLARLSPPRLPSVDPVARVPDRRIALEASWLLGCAAAFAVVLGVLAVTSDAAGGIGFVVAKAVFLVAVPLAVLSAPRWIGPLGGWYLAGPVLPVAGWFALAWVGPLARPSDGAGMPAGAVEAVLLLTFLFLVNAGLEEVFYRMWLQSRLEHLLGRWPAILTASLLWGSWHLAFKATGDPVVDVAATVAYFVPTGVALGYLWSRYRNPLAVLLVHGAINAPLGLVLAVG